MNHQESEQSSERTSPASEPGCANQFEDAEIESLKKTNYRFIVINAADGQRHFFNKPQDLCFGLLDGTFNATTTVVVYAKTSDAKWEIESSPLAEFGKRHFKLRVLYEPVWAHAMMGLKWGAFVGIALKLLQSFIPLFSANTVLMAKFSMTFCLSLALSATLVGAVLVYLPAMLIGGLIGLSRKDTLPLAKDALPERGRLVQKTVVFPLIGAITLWVLYLSLLNPWVLSTLEKHFP